MTTTAVRTGVAGVRAATAGSTLVARRRGVSDAGLLLLTAVVLAVTVALTLVVPGVVARAADEAVQQAVVDAGDSADVVARIGSASSAGFGTSMSTRDPNGAATLRRDAAAVHDALPAPLRDITGPGVTSVATPIVHGRVGTTAITTRLAYVGVPDAAAQEALVRWVDGKAPAPAVLPVDDPDVPLPRHELQVGMQADAAAALGVRAGDRAKLSLYTFGPLDVVVTGLYTVPDPDARTWTQFPDLLGVRDAASPAQAGHVALLVTDASLPDARLVVQARALVAQVRYRPDGTLVGAGSVDGIRTAVTQTQADPTELTRAAASPVTVTTSLGETLDAVDGRLAAARAQQSVLVLGLSGVGALVLVLAARLLVARRETFLLAERARGASIASVVVRALLESVPIAVVAGVAGALLARLLLPSADGGGAVVAVALVVVAALTPAVVAALQVRGAYAGRRVAANRADRDRVRGRRRARRVVAEATLVAIAVGAVVSVRGRGLAQTSTGEVDLLLAATPLLVAAAATLVVARVLPPLLRALSRAARSRRGLVPVVATARASAASGTAVPLLTLTVAIGLVVFCGTTVLTVGAGQSTAADARVGADVRIEGPLTGADVTDLRAQPGVTAVAGIAVLGGRTLGLDSGTTVDLVLVDAEPLAAIETAHGRSDEGLRSLARGSADAETPAALVSPWLSAAVELVDPDILTNTGRITLDVVGTVGDDPRVRTDGAGDPVDGRVLVDRATFDAIQEAPTEPSAILLDGPGALSATQALHLADRPGVTVVDRDGWLEEWRESPLNRDLVLLLLGTSVALAAYAALALVLMVAATSRERGRALSALRTLGLDARTASALTFAELLPVATAAVVGGTAIGVLIPWLTSGALGLELATGGFGPPALRVGWWPIVGAVAVVAAALLVTVLVESAVRRRDKLGEVLRVGER